MQRIYPVIFGAEAHSLTSGEKELFKRVRPSGLILFARNCQSKQQVSDLIQEFIEITDNEDSLVLIDQEGGRVARLKAPEWKEFPAPGTFRVMAEEEGLAKAEKAIYKNYRAMGEMLAELGINVDCAPVADLLFEGAHNIIGDRALGKNPEMVVALARKVCEGLMDAGVTPVIKHIPGHGRALVDSHEKLPVVNESLDVLEKTDFAPFRALSDIPFAMTAHILFTALDAENVVTLSEKAISYIREKMGYQWNLISDDISMKALSGDLGDLAVRALDAGCDYVLHCNGNFGEMSRIATSLEQYMASEENA